MPRGPAHAFALCLAAGIGGLAVADLALRSAPPFWRALAAGHAGRPAHADAVLRLAGRPGVVVVGGSVAVRDVDEVALGRLLGLAAVNLGINGAPAETVAMRISDAFAARPDVLVYVAGPLSLSTMRQTDPSLGWDPAPAWAIDGAGGIARRPGFHARGLLGEVSVLVRYHDELQSRLHVDEADRATTHPRDRVVPAAHQREMARAVLADDARWPTDGTGPNVTGYRWMLDEAARLGVPMLVVQAPLHPRAWRRAGRDDRAAPILRAEALARGIPVLTWGEEVVPADYPASVFQDPLHLARPGQERFTALVAERLTRMLSG